MPTRLCSHPRCPNPATTRGRCPDHARATDQAHTRAGHAIYRTHRWQLLRRHILTAQPLCPGIYGEPCGDIATDVDHITALTDNGDPWDPQNLQGLCQPCHARKTRQEQLARR